MPRIIFPDTTPSFQGPTQRGTVLNRTQFKAEDFSSAAIGGAVKQVTKVYQDLQKKQKLAEDTKNTVWANKALAQFNNDLIGDSQNLERTAEEGAVGHVENYRGFVDNKIQEILNASPTEDIANALESKLMAGSSKYLRQAVNFQAVETGRKITRDVDETSDLHANTALSVGTYEQWDMSLDAVRGDVASINNPNFTKSQEAALLEAQLEKVSFAAAKGIIANSSNPEEAQVIIEEMDKEQNIYKTRLNNENYRSLRTFAKSRKGSLEREEEAEDAKIEQKANVNQSMKITELLLDYESGKVSLEELQIAAGALRKQEDPLASTARLLRSIGTRLKASYKVDLKAVQDAEQSKYDWAVSSKTLAASVGGLTIDQLAELKAQEFFKNPKDYEKALRAAQLYNDEQDALEKGDQKRQLEARTEINKIYEAAKKQEKLYQDLQAIRDSGYGLLTEQEIRGHGFDPKMLDKALKARNRFEALTDKEKQKAAEEVNGWAYVDLKIATKRATSAPEFKKIRDSLTTMRENKTITPGQYDTIDNLLNTQTIKEKIKTGYFANFSKALASNNILDPKMGAEESKHFNEWYQQVAAGIFLAASEEARLNPDMEQEIMSRALNASTSIIQKTGIVPSSVQSEIRKGLGSADATVVLQAAEHMVRIHSASPALANVFSKEEFSIGNEIIRHVENRVPPEEALMKTMEGRSPENADQRASRRTEFNAENNEDAVVAKLKQLIDDDDKWDVYVSGYAKMPQEFIDSYSRLAEDEYARTGNMAIAHDTAYRIMKGGWGVSYMSGEPKFEKQPPELMYGVGDLSAEENSEWIKEQLIRELSVGGLVEKNIGDRVILKPHPRIMNGTKPTYVVYIIGKQGIEKVKGAFVPDYSKSTRKKRIELEIEERGVVARRLAGLGTAKGMLQPLAEAAIDLQKMTDISFSEATPANDSEMP